MKILNFNPPPFFSPGSLVQESFTEQIILKSRVARKFVPGRAFVAFMYWTKPSRYHVVHKRAPQHKACLSIKSTWNATLCINY